MIILDFLFLICYTPFSQLRRTEKRSEGDVRFATLLALVPILCFVSVGIINIMLYYLGFKTTALGVALTIISLGTSLFLILNKVYVTRNRDIGRARFPILSGVLIFVMIVGSIIFMSYCLAKFR